MIKGSSTRGADRVSVRAVLRGVPAAAQRPPRRRTKALVGWLIYCGVAVGGTAAAFTVHDALFPALGSAPTPNKVWGNTIAADFSTLATWQTEIGWNVVMGAAKAFAR